MVSLSKKAYVMTIRNRVINSYKFIYSYVYICMLVWGSCTRVCVQLGSRRGPHIFWSCWPLVPVTKHGSSARTTKRL